MKKRWLTTVFLSLLTLAASSQTLFTYGDSKADAKDFLRAFNKNNQQTTAAKSKAMREYLDLYINSRLKIHEAYLRGYDTLAQIKIEVDELRRQIIENYMSEPESINRLSKEAFQRSQKDIHVAHIFISSKDANGMTDTLLARKKLNEVMRRLDGGEDFMTLAQQVSDDPSAKSNKGDLDYITVFTLPYEFENIIYTTPVGKFSRPYTSKAGFHIFKNLGERKSLGKVKLQQILLAFPPNITEAGKKQTAALADSLYQRILKGDDFSKLATDFSNDPVSAATSGKIPDISVGQYDASFEKIAWSLKNNTVSKPFLTSHGYHIVKKISSIATPTNPNDKINNDALQQKVMSDERWKTSRDFIYARVKTKAGFKKYPYPDAALWALSDSLLDYKPVGIGRSMTVQSALFKLGDTSIRVMDWINYAQGNRYKTDRTGLKPYPDLMDEFTKSAMYQYYRDHLEDFNDEFKNQMTEFKDGNLFFEIMQQEVWNKAQSDSAALVSLYEKNKSHYNWKQSADAVIFFCSDESNAKALAASLKKNPSDWRKAVEPLSEKVVADSARYEWSTIPGLGNLPPKSGTLSKLTVNPTDNSSSFAYIVKVYPQPGARTFPEAKGLVMNDYQNQLEEEWIKQLKKKYNVVIDQKVFAAISK